MTLPDNLQVVNYYNLAIAALWDSSRRVNSKRYFKIIGFLSQYGLLINAYWCLSFYWKVDIV